MASLPNSKTVIYEEWLRMPEVSDAIEEVVNGEIRIMPAASWKHQRIVELTGRALERQLDTARFSFARDFGLSIRKAPVQHIRVAQCQIRGRCGLAFVLVGIFAYALVGGGRP